MKSNKRCFICGRRRKWSHDNKHWYDHVVPSLAKAQAIRDARGK